MERINILKLAEKEMTSTSATEYGFGADKCPVDGQPMSKATISGKEEVFWCPTHRITMPVPNNEALNGCV